MATFDPIDLHAIDYDRLNDLYDGDNEQIASLFELFLEAELPDFQEIEAQIAQQHWLEVAKGAHKMIPLVGMVGLTALENKLRSIETQAKKGISTEEIGASWYQFRAGLDLAIPLIREEMTKLVSQ
ncbi:hypothetical protein GCM10028805_00210 [Spirosoma harenae]